ncbi:MAG: 2-oxoacid:acceptor oxidoreductase subunit alpha [Planctomycetota bacterium]|nr:MAG: 2-oxoacid:acceptor oxidoreductase subunit alpha [Planctomycetota bacterium]
MPASVTNEFSINVATVNGSGSASSNTILTKSIFRMGVPVSPKNLFPSNISGLPTWFLIRVSEAGWRARTGRNEVVIALNPTTLEQDHAGVAPGGVLLVEAKSRVQVQQPRSDVTILSCPMAELAKPHAPDPRLRKLLTNMVYVGVVAHLLDLDVDVVMQTVADQFSGKQKIVALNQAVVQEGLDWAAANLADDVCPFTVAARDLTGDKMLIEGNTAAALGCLMGGCTFVGWYPITPSTSICEDTIAFAHRFRRDEDSGALKFASVQAEDELSSIGHILGAGWAGARAMTATSGPGISLMAEFAGFGYYTEIPAVLFDVQRVGPSTGMPTRTQQGDLSLCFYLSHGDTKHIVLLPAGPEELYEMSQQAFDLAERFQTPVFVLSDLDMGMNLWMSDRLAYPEAGFDRGKVLDAEALEQVKEFHRYADPDGDGVPYRTLPGTRHPKAPYFTRGSGHTTRATYTENSEEYKEVVDRIRRKIDGSTSHTPAPLTDGDRSSKVGLIHWGSTRYPVEEAVALLADEGISVCEMRVRALPLHDAVIDFVNDCDITYVVEQNRDGQLADIIRLKVPGSAGKIRKINYYAGMPMSAEPVVEAVRAGARETANV